MLKLYNTLTRAREAFQPLKSGEVGLYTCGPTVYDFAHIGNYRTYLFEDFLQRLLEYNGYAIRRAMNITDVGHLVGDGDEGEDKLEVGARREGKNPLEIARKYEKKFFEDLQALNIEIPQADRVVRASEAIPEQIEIIKLLMEKGFAYRTPSAIYFDVAKFPEYGALAGQKLSEKSVQSRNEVVVDEEKHNPQDFALWFFLAGRYADHILKWPSQWGEGFPGWHVECSAICRKLLGQPFDIHTGGVDHIGTHHPNEMAQSEAAYGMPLANLWMHGEFLLIDSGRMGKSEGNLLTLDALVEKGFRPLDYRYLCLTAHYRTQLNFVSENLQAAHNSLSNLYSRYTELRALSDRTNAGQHTGLPLDAEEDFLAAVNDDLNMPKALSILWQTLKSDKYQPRDKVALIEKFDLIFGLSVRDHFAHSEAITEELQALLAEREEARKNRDFTKSDQLREQIARHGYEVKDTPEGQKINRK